MEITNKLEVLRKSIDTTDELVEELIAILKAQKLKVANKEKKILFLKEKIDNNVDKIDKIIENYNANS